MYIKTKKDLEKRLVLKVDERKWSEDMPHLPILISDHIFSLIDPDDPDDPIRRQFVPSCLEEEDNVGDMDPLEEVRNEKAKRFIHTYENRAVLLMTDRCFSYCRHCFRRRFTGTEIGEVRDEELEEIGAYIKEHNEIKEILLSGGDMFTISNKRIDQILSFLKARRDDIILRLCTRALVSEPKRFDDELFSVLRKNQKGAPYFLMTQFNHPRELTKEAVKAIRMLHDAGAVIRNQTVLLKGVNDSPEVLSCLMNSLVSNGVMPYYVFQCRPVEGVKNQFQVPLERGSFIVDNAKKMMSGPAKAFRYVMSHPSGKIEILGKLGDEMLFKYHQAKRVEDSSRFFTRKAVSDECWF